MTLLTLLGSSTAGMGDGLYLEFAPADGATAGTLKLFRKDGTQLGTTLNLLCAEPDIWHRITACYDPDTDEFTACFDARDSDATVTITTEGETGTNEVQSLAVFGPSAYTLAFGGETTAELAHDATAAEIQAALELLASIGAGNVSVTGAGPFAIEFTGTLAETDVATVVATPVREWAVQGQCVSEDVPADFVAGTKAGYGGVGSIKNYKYDRLWYCGEPPYTSACTPDVDGDGQYYDDYYYPVEPRTICHRCGSTSCTVVSETFAGLPDGDMPCGWDADATDWQVVSGKATGNGPVCHKYDMTAGSHIVSASFAIGDLATQGDSVTVSLTYGSATHSVTITRVAGISPEPPPYPDRYLYEWLPADFLPYYSALKATSITLTICPYHICNNAVQTIIEEVVTPGPVCVSITQPTMSGHTDAALTSITITKSKVMDDDCPECECTTVCADYCKDSIWPSGFLAELIGLESACCDVEAMNRGYYINQYASPCLSVSPGDDGLGVVSPTEGTECIRAWGAGGIAYNEVAIWLASDESSVQMSAGLYPASVFSLYPWSYRANYSRDANATHAIVVSMTRTIFTSISGATAYVTSYWGKYYASVTDCKNFVDEELDFLTSSAAWRVTVGSNLFSIPYSYGIDKCDTPIINPHPTIPGLTVDIWLRLFGTGCHFWYDSVLNGYIMVLDSTHSASKIKLTAL